MNWRLLLNTFYWNLNYWDSAATFSGDVINPEKNYPSGILLAVLLVFMSTFLPILVGTGAYEGDWSDWSDGFFITLGVEIVGPWLGYWMLLASTMTNVGMFEAEMSSDAWQVAGMAERGIIPKIFGQRSKYESPHYGVLLSLLFYCNTHYVRCEVGHLSAHMYVWAIAQLAVVWELHNPYEFLIFINLQSRHNLATL